MTSPFVKKAAFLLFLVIGLTGIRPAAHKPDTGSSLEGVVLPDNVHDRQPFSFSVPSAAPQSQIDIKTLDGVVVEHKSPDKYGRVFLDAGLAAGSYLISSAKGEAGRVDIKPRPADLPQPMSREVWLSNPPLSVKVGDPLWLSGHGFSPNSADMVLRLYQSGKTEAPVVLAATEDQLKLAPIENVKPGAAELKVINQATQQGAPSQTLYFYDLQGRLLQNKLKKGQETTVVLESLPADIRMKVNIQISGQATFGGGRRELDTVIENGHLTIPILADRGAGPFNIEYEGTPLIPQVAGCGCGCGGSTQPACAHKGCSCAGLSTAGKLPPHFAGCACGCGGTAQPACAHKNCACANALARADEVKNKQAACSCGCGGTAQPACAHKNCACANSVAEDLKRKQVTCGCGCGGTAQPACAHKNCACANAADAGIPVTLQSRLENVAEMEKPTGKKGCSCGCGGTAQPRCTHKACGCAG